MSDPRDTLVLWLWGVLAAFICVTGWASRSEPIHADPQPVATCMLTKPAEIAPGVFDIPNYSARVPPRYYPCKLLKKEQDV